MRQGLARRGLVPCTGRPCRYPAAPWPTDRVKQILSWYASDNPGVQTNLARMMNHGTLAGTGKFVILPVDQGFEHGPARSFSPNPPAYDPDYHFQLAIDAGCNAYAAPLGFLEAVGRQVRRADPAHPQAQQLGHAGQDGPAVQRGDRLGEGRACASAASAIGYTIYPGSGARNTMYEELRELILEAKEQRPADGGLGLPARRGPVEGRRDRRSTSCAYAAQIACQLGAHIVKVKPPKDVVEQAEAKKVFEKYDIPTKTLADRVRHVRAERASTASASSSSRAARPRTTPRCSTRSRSIAAGGALRLDHGPQRLPAPARRGAQAPRRRDEHLPLCLGLPVQKRVVPSGRRARG